MAALDVYDWFASFSRQQIPIQSHRQACLLPELNNSNAPIQTVSAKRCAVTCPWCPRRSCYCSGAGCPLQTPCLEQTRTLCTISHIPHAQSKNVSTRLRASRQKKLRKGPDVCLPDRQERNMPIGIATTPIDSRHDLTVVIFDCHFPGLFITRPNDACVPPLHSPHTPRQTVYTVLLPAVHNQRGVVRRVHTKPTTCTYRIPVTSDPFANTLLHTDLRDRPPRRRCL